MSLTAKILDDFDTFQLVTIYSTYKSEILNSENLKINIGI